MERPEATQEKPLRIWITGWWSCYFIHFSIIPEERIVQHNFLPNQEKNQAPKCFKEKPSLKSREARPWNWVVAITFLDIISELVFHFALGVYPGLSSYNLTHFAYVLFLFTSSHSLNFLLFFVISKPISPHSQGCLHCIMLCLHSSMSLFILELKTTESDSTVMWFLQTKA